MDFPLNIPSDDAAIFSENSDQSSTSWDAFTDSDQDTEDPTGPRGQAKENAKVMFRAPLPPPRSRRVKSASAFPSSRVSQMTPGARKIP